MVMNADGSEPRQVGRSVGTAAASWAPDSRRLVYADGERWFIDALDGSDDAELIVPTKAPDSPPSWSPDGGLIAYKGGSAADGTLGVWVAEADGSGARQISAPIGAGQDVSTPVWSPDGASVAFFVGPASGGAFDVHIASVDRMDEIAVTTAGPDEYWPVWSPDGSRFVFDRVTVPSNNLVQLVVAGPHGSDPVMLESEPLFGLTPVWAPDGSVVAMQLPEDPSAESAWGTASDLVLLDPTGTTEPRLLPVPGAFGSHSWQRLAP
jgi:Tol biopolymer transport system component